MARKSGGKRSGQTPGGLSPRRRPRTVKRDENTTQLIERGEGPTAEEQVDPNVDSPSEITTEGGPGTDAAYRLGGPFAEDEPPPNERREGTGGEGGYSTLGGGVYQDEGAPEDAPRYGDWQRHSSGTTSGALGNEGLSFPGEQTWGEEQRAAERQAEQRRPGTEHGSRPRRRS